MTQRCTVQQCLVTRLEWDASGCSFHKQKGRESARDRAWRERGDNGTCVPTDAVLRALGACTAMTLRIFAESVGLELGTVSVGVTALDDASGPRIFRHILLGLPKTHPARVRLAAICERTPWTVILKKHIAVHTEFF